MIAAVFTWSSFQVVAQAGETQTQPSSLVELRKPEVKLREDNTAKFVDIHWRGGRERVKHGGEYKYSKDVQRDPLIFWRGLGGCRKSLVKNHQKEAEKSPSLHKTGNRPHFHCHRGKLGNKWALGIQLRMDSPEQRG